MRRAESEQSRVLRRRVIGQLLAMWLAYSIVFVGLAAVFNAFAAPQIGNWIADRTSVWVNYNTQDYLQEYTTDQLWDRLEKTIGEYGIDNINISKFTQPVDMDMDAFAVTGSVVDAVLAAADAAAENDAVPDAEAAGIVSDATTETPTDTSGASASDKTAEANGADKTVETSPTYVVGLLAISGGITNDIEAEIVETVTSPASKSVLEANGLFKIENEGAGASTVSEIPVTPQGLACFAMNDDFRLVRIASGHPDMSDWQVIPHGDDGSFSARDLSEYNNVRRFKLPVAISIYVVGCLVIVAVQLARALGYFDKLSRAVADLMKDREKPVQLPRDLALAQAELNGIRLESLNDERAAQAAEQRKNELVAYLAHDIRTPLTSVIGYLTLLEEVPDMPPEQRQRYTQIAAAKAERLEKLIDEFFEITRYNLQSIPIERNTAHVRLFLEQVVEEFYPQASDKNVQIQVDAPADATFFVDAEKLARAVGNVVRNAVAYAEANSTVHVNAHLEESAPDSDGGNSDGSSVWRITVTNTGREISSVHLQSIFEKFYREDGARSADSGGAGLGLAIAREIIVAHAGAITAASENGLTTFTITLPQRTRE